MVASKIEADKGVDDTQKNAARAKDTVTLHDLSWCAGLIVDAMTEKAHDPGRDDKSEDDEAQDLVARVQTRRLAPGLVI